MPWNGSGVFTRLYDWVTDRDNGIPITASRIDADEDDLASGLMQCLTIDGQTLPTGNLPMRGYRHTGAGAAVNTGDYVTLGQLTAGNALALSVASLNVSGNETVSGTSNLNQINANGITAGGLTVTNPILTTGANAAVEFQARDNTSQNWLWYATGNVARLWMNGDRVWVDTSGSLTVGNQLAVNGANTWVNSLWAGGTVQGGYLVSTGDVHANNNLTAGGGVSAPGNCNLGGYVTVTDFRSNANVYVPNGYVYAGQYLQSGTDVNVGRNLSVSGTASVNALTINSLQVNGSGTITSNLTVNGATTLGGFSFGGGTINGGLTVTGNLAVNSPGSIFRQGMTVSPASGQLVTFQINSGDGEAFGDWFANSYQINSDAQLKVEVRDWAPGLAAVAALRPVDYRIPGPFDDGSRRQGLVADEVEQIIPEIVHRRRSQRGRPDSDEETEILSVDLGALAAALVGAVKELTGQIEDLTHRITALEDKWRADCC